MILPPSANRDPFHALQDAPDRALPSTGQADDMSGQGAGA
jgi:hypothetical protein